MVEYSKFTPIGAVTTIVPVGVVQVGWIVALAVGAAIVGTAFMVKAIGFETQPATKSLTVTL